MKTRVVLILILAVSLTNAKNPYEHFGYDNSEMEAKMENLRQNKFLLINEDTTSEISALFFDFNLTKVSIIARNGYVEEKQIPEEMQLRWSSVDPLAGSFQSKSPYGFVSNNPINRIDPDGRADYYTRDGIHRGNDGKDDNRTMLSQDKPSVAKKDWSYFDNATDLKIGHDKFSIMSNIIKLEGKSDDIREYLGFAFASRNWSNNLKKSQYSLLMSGYSSVEKVNKIPIGTKNTNQNKLARSALIQSMVDDFDPTNGATHWDGTDFIAWGLNSPYNNSHAKFRQYTSISININHYNIYVANNGNYEIYSGKRYQIPAQIFKDTKINKQNNLHIITNAKRSNQSIHSVGAWGKSIFWKVTND